MSQLQALGQQNSAVDVDSALPDAAKEQQRKQQTYYEWARDSCSKQYKDWKPWLEDQYLWWMTKDNKASYATRDTLSKTKVSGITQVDTLQDSVHNVVGAQIGQGGLLAPVTDVVSKEGINRFERSGKDEQGSYGGAVQSGAESAGQTVLAGGQKAAGGVKAAGGYLGGVMGRK